MIRDLDIAGSNTDARRWEVVTEGLSIFGGVQLALDATLVSTHHGDGTLLRKSDKMDGVALQLARRRKEARYPELSGDHTEGPVWWSLLAKLVDDGPARLRFSCNLWHTAKLRAHLASFGRAQRWREEVVQFVGVFGGQSGWRGGATRAAGQLPSVQEVLGDARRAV